MTNFWLNLGDTIHGRVPDNQGRTFPPELTSGTYDLRETDRAGNPSLFEGKFIVDKTYGHLAYGWLDCCGYTATEMLANPEQLAVQGQDHLSVQAYDACFDDWTPQTGHFSGWDSGNHSVAMLSSNQITGMGVGSTDAFASGQLLNSGPPRHCPMQPRNPANTTNVCAIPSSESTEVAGTAASKGYPAITEFNQTISDTRDDSFDSRSVEEMSEGPGVDTCYWAGNPLGNVQYPVVTGGEWTVAGGDVSGQHNHWGYDNVGYPNSAAPAYIRTYGPAHGISIPCTESLFQNMVMWCDAWCPRFALLLG